MTIKHLCESCFFAEIEIVEDFVWDSERLYGRLLKCERLSTYCKKKYRYKRFVVKNCNSYVQKINVLRKDNKTVQKELF